VRWYTLATVRVLLQHRSRYRYPQPALLGPQLLRLRPADHARARIDSYRLEVRPEHRVHWQRDPHGNRVARVTFKAGQAIEELEIDPWKRHYWRRCRVTTPIEKRDDEERQQREERRGQGRHAGTRLANRNGFRCVTFLRRPSC
jgi:hypothetical protein